MAHLIFNWVILTINHSGIFRRYTPWHTSQCHTISMISLWNPHGTIRNIPGGSKAPVPRPPRRRSASGAPPRPRWRQRSWCWASRGAGLWEDVAGEGSGRDAAREGTKLFFGRSGEHGGTNKDLVKLFLGEMVIFWPTIWGYRGCNHRNSDDDLGRSCVYFFLSENGMTRNILKGVKQQKSDGILGKRIHDILTNNLNIHT
jgi:hypothetical protein